MRHLLVGITLRNNLKTLFLAEGKQYPWLLERVFFPLLTIIPPVIIALITLRIDVLVGITGSYGGAGQWLCYPCVSVVCWSL